MSENNGMISDEAVEAAARETYRVAADFAYESDSWDDLSDGQREAFMEDARKILEAAAPHMLARQQSALDSVLALHRGVECRDEDDELVGGSYCEECKDLDDHSGERVHEVYPCMTVREITKTLAGEETFTAMRDRIEAMTNPYRSKA